MKSILLYVADDSSFDSRLGAALDLARFSGGHLECLQTRRLPGYVGADTIGYSGSAAMLVQLMDDEAKRAEDERALLTKRLKGEGIPFSFAEAIGDPAQTLVSHSLLADAIVLTLPEEGRRDDARALSAVVTHADAPVIAIPHHCQRLQLERPAMIAWKPTREAAAAVKRAVPLLQRMERVDLVAIDPVGAGDLPALAVGRYLSRHGIKCELHEQRRDERTTSDALLATAGELGAGLLIMGGYGRGAAMEFLLGGVTRRLLAASTVPLLLAH